MSVQRQIERLVVHRAAEWLEVLRTARTEEYRAFLSWISESPRHVDEFLKLVALSHEAQQVIRESTLDKETLLARVSPQVTELRTDRRSPKDKGNSRWIHWSAVLAAVCAAVALVVRGSFNESRRLQCFATPVGVRHTITLGDGSTVILNGKSRIQVRLQSSDRDIRLIQGNAAFWAANEAKATFLVHRRNSVAWAGGAQLDVARRF